MRDLIIKSNVTTADRLGFFSSQWVEHSVSQSLGRLTDMTLVVKEGETWFRVAVHRAVIMPLCTFLNEIEKDVNKEDLTVILPEISLELLEALIRLVYKGFAPLSAVVTADNLLLLMRMLGLTMPAERLMVTREKVEEEVEIIGFKNLYGLEILETTRAGMEKVSQPKTERRRSLEITPCRTSATPEIKKRRSRRQVLVRSSKSRDSSRPSSDVNDNLKPNAESGEAVEGIIIPMMPLQVKLECEEVQDVSQNNSGKIHREEREVSDIPAKRRRKSTIPSLTCELCDFKCHFVNDMQKHYDANHCSNENMCTLCGFKASTLGGLRVHSARKHNVDKNTVKLVEAEPVASEVTISSNNCEENLANADNAIIREEKEYSVDGGNVSMTPECIDANESVKQHVENYCINENMCTFCGFKASTLGGLRVHSARKHNVGKNIVKLSEGDDKLAEAEPVVLFDENIANKNFEENLVNANTGISREEKDNLVDDNVSMTPVCENAKESVKEAIVSDETKGVSSVNTLSANTNTPNQDAEIPAKDKDNSDMNGKMRKTETICADNVKGEMQVGFVNKMVENSYDSFASSANNDSEDGIDENSSVTRVDNVKFGKKNLLGEVEDDPLTILKNVKAELVKEKVKTSKGKGRGKKTSNPLNGVQTKKDGLIDDKDIVTENVNVKTDKIMNKEETDMM